MHRSVFRISVLTFALFVAETARAEERQAGWEMFASNLEDATGAIESSSPTPSPISSPTPSPGLVNDATGIVPRSATPESVLSFIGTSGDLAVVNTRDELEQARKMKIPRILLGGRVYLLEADGLYHDPTLKTLKDIKEDQRLAYPNPAFIRTATNSASEVVDSTSTAYPPPWGPVTFSDDLPIINTEPELERAMAQKIPRILLGGRVFVLEEDGKYHDPVLRAWREEQEKREREFTERFAPDPTPAATPVAKTPQGAPGSIIRDVKPPTTWRRWPNQGRRNRTIR